MFTAFVRRVDRVARSFFFIKVSFWMRWKALASKEEQPHKKKAVLPYRNVVLAIRKRTA